MTDELRLPCRESETPDDWFIGRDGRQYTDEDLVSQQERDSISDQVMRDAATDDVLTIEEARDAADRAIDRAETDAKKAALIRRRKAREACHTSCLLRTRCLGQAIEGGQEYGTWGGYYEEELRGLRREIARRQRANT